MSSILASIDRYTSVISPALLGAVVLAITLVLGALRNVGKSTPKSQVASRSTGDDAEEVDINKDRADGEWRPVKFRYPDFKAVPERISEIRPIPYRPFRWGAYHVNMGIKNMPWDDWIELDQDHVQYHKIKAHRLKHRLGEGRPVHVVPDGANGLVRGGGLAAVELVHELAEYLSRRYPGDFTVTRHAKRVLVATTSEGGGGSGSNRVTVNGNNDDAEGGDLDCGVDAFSDWGWNDLPAVKTITMTSAGVSYDLPLSLVDGDRAGERAMEIAGLLIQDDLALMLEGSDGKYYFQAGSITLPGFWRIQDKIGMPLEEIHLSGNVPQYKEKLQTSLERFFRRLPVGKPVVRNNYFFQVTVPKEKEERADGEEETEAELDKEELAWARSTLGPEEEYGIGGHGWDKMKDGDRTVVEWVSMRSERQTLRRLGRSGAVVFTIRTYLTPVVELGKEEGVAGRLASALRSWPEDVGRYKGQGKGGWYSVVLAYLDQIGQA